MENLSYFQFELWAQILKWLFLFEVTSYMPSWVKKVNTQNTSPYSTESLTHRGMNDWRYTVPQNSIHWISSHRELNLKGVKSNGESWRKLWKTVLCFQFHLVLHSWTLKWFIHVLKKKKKILRFTFPDAQLNFRDCISKFQPSKTDQTIKLYQNQINICY